MCQRFERNLNTVSQPFKERIMLPIKFLDKIGATLKVD